MSVLFDQAIYAVARLPRKQQDAIARSILDRIDANARWDVALANPDKEADLDCLADELCASLMRLSARVAPA